MGDLSPILVVAMFFDDIRMEVGNKLSLIGGYASSLAVNNPAIPVDRLAVLVQVRWNPDHHKPAAIAARISVPGQNLIRQEFPIPQVGAEPLPTPFRSVTLQAAVQLRFPPLRVGDAIEVWAEVDGVDYPAGRLLVEAGRPLDSSVKDPATKLA